MRASLLALLLAGGCLAATGQDAAPGTPILDKGRSVQTEGPQVPTVTPQLRGVAAACAPATALRNLEWNNVRALLENGGSLWYNRSIDKGAYIVPKESGVSVVYGGALWLAGISPDQQLKLAAVHDAHTGLLGHDVGALVDGAVVPKGTAVLEQGPDVVPFEVA